MWLWSLLGLGFIARNRAPPAVITWKNLENYKAFENSNSLEPHLERSGVELCAMQAKSPLGHLAIFSN